MQTRTSRRRFVKTIVAAGAVGTNIRLAAQQAGKVSGFDHVALPMQDTDAMVSFYRSLGCEVRENANLVSVYVGTQMINFHRPTLWQSASFTLRAPAAKPPCGDLCFVWDGTAASLKAMLERANAKIETGPVDRSGGRQKTGSRVYTRDPEGNLIEFMIYA